MADMKLEKTFKHRNIIDDILDLGLLILMVAWYFTGIDLDKETLATTGAIGASARGLLRRILTKLWGPRLGIEPDSVPAAEAALEAAVASEKAAEEAAEESE